MIIQCCKCKKIRHGHKWTRVLLDGLDGPVSHTYCPVCYREFAAQIANEFKTRGLENSRFYDLAGAASPSA